MEILDFRENVAWKKLIIGENVHGKNNTIGECGAIPVPGRKKIKILDEYINQIIVQK